MEPAEMFEFSLDRQLCLVSHLREYICQTGTLRQGPQLFIAFVKPHLPISRSTFSLGQDCAGNGLNSQGLLGTADTV